MTGFCVWETCVDLEYFVSKFLIIFIKLLVISAIVMLINNFIVSDFFVGFLEHQRVTIYFFSDCLFLALGLVLTGLVVAQYGFKWPRRYYGWMWYSLPLFMLVRLLLLEHYPNVPRSEIGYFYKMPEGQSITYPKYPRDTPSTAHP